MTDPRILVCDGDPALLGLLARQLEKIRSALDLVSDGPSQISPRVEGSESSGWAVTGGLEPRP